MKKIAAIIAAVFMCVAFMPQTATAAPTHRTAHRTAGCTQEVKKVVREASPLVDDLDRHDMTFTLWVNYEYCPRSGYSYSRIWSLDGRIVNGTHSGACHNIQTMEMNPNYIGSWNVGNISRDCVSGQDVYTWHRNAPDNLTIDSTDSSAARCIGAYLKVRIGELRVDWDGNTANVCVI